jgi:phosphoribosyl-AMP cyclohydrolase
MSLLSLPEGLAFDADGLIPVVVQDRSSGDVLMLAYANAEAVARTAETGLAHFWSRSRRALWRKGETSGSFLHVRALRTDCDRDALLMVVDPRAPPATRAPGRASGTPRRRRRASWPRSSG